MLFPMKPIRTIVMPRPFFYSNDLIESKRNNKKSLEINPDNTNAVGMLK